MRWRRWRPRGTTQAVAVQHEDILEKDPFVATHQRLRKLSLRGHFWKRDHDFRLLNQLIDEAKQVAGKAPVSDRAEAWLYALALQAPRAAVAQESMDEHPHGYHNKEARLFELIDFNDAFVASILSLPNPMLTRATLEVKRLCEAACKKAGTRCFSDEQFEAITHGLSREIAVFHGLSSEGYEVEMTNRASDALGIDMRIVDPRELRAVNIDIKTRSAYRYRIEQLQREGRLSEETFLMADRNGFAIVYNGHHEQRTKVVIWRIDHERLGDVVNFTFTDTTILGVAMHTIMLAAGEKL